MIGYVLTDAAESDLDDLIRYTRDRWGAKQVRSYVAKLERCFERLAAIDGRWIDVSDLQPSLRFVRCEHHYVYGLPREGEPALIVAILHERMDLMSRLADRLG